MPDFNWQGPSGLRLAFPTLRSGIQQIDALREEERYVENLRRQGVCRQRLTLQAKLKDLRQYDDTVWDDNPGMKKIQRNSNLRSIHKTRTLLAGLQRSAEDDALLAVMFRLQDLHNAPPHGFKMPVAPVPPGRRRFDFDIQAPPPAYHALHAAYQAHAPQKIARRLAARTEALAALHQLGGVMPPLAHPAKEELPPPPKSDAPFWK